MIWSLPAILLAIKKEFSTSRIFLHNEFAPGMEVVIEIEKNSVTEAMR